MDDKTSEFIRKARDVHGDRYIYDKVKYVDVITKVIIICRIHGDFEQIPRNHLNGANCKKCGNENTRKKQSGNKEEFIKQAREIHGDKYNYDKVVYVNNHTPVIINCSIHGDFSMRPKDHIGKKNGCKQCGIEARRKKRSLTTEQFIERAVKLHGDRYDYSKTVYVNSQTDIIIICKLHKIEFTLTPNRHLTNILNGCPTCRSSGLLTNGKLETTDNRRRITYTTEEFIEIANDIHDFKYDYSKTKYVNNYTKVIIGCKKHGYFEQRPSSHIWKRIGCRHCSYEKMAKDNSMTLEEFIDKANKLHNNKYTYENTVYVNNRTPVVITCKEHGDFLQTPYTHLEPCGCPVCAAEKRGIDRRMTLVEFIKRAKKVHGDKYDYSKVVYINNSTKIEIICKKHGSFFQTPAAHIFNKNKCYKCSKNGYSAKAIQWLIAIGDKHGINIQHAENGGEYKIPGTNFKVDGYCADRKLIYEFHGCYFHGCPVCFKNPTVTNTLLGKTYGDLYTDTISRQKIIESKGYKIITRWEHEWDSALKNKPYVKQIVYRNNLLQRELADLYMISQLRRTLDVTNGRKIKQLIRGASINMLVIVISMLIKSAYLDKMITYQDIIDKINRILVEHNFIKLN